MWLLRAKIEVLAVSAFDRPSHWPTLNIASPDRLSAPQNWHYGVIWDPTPPLISSEEGMVDEARAEVDPRLLLSSGEEKFSSVTRDEVAVDWSLEMMRKGKGWMIMSNSMWKLTENGLEREE